MLKIFPRAAEYLSRRCRRPRPRPGCSPCEKRRYACRHRLRRHIRRGQWRLPRRWRSGPICASRLTLLRRPPSIRRTDAGRIAAVRRHFRAEICTIRWGSPSPPWGITNFFEREIGALSIYGPSERTCSGCRCGLCQDCDSAVRPWQRLPAPETHPTARRAGFACAGIRPGWRGALVAMDCPCLHATLSCQ
jgi:hypothetical protein